MWCVAELTPEYLQKMEDVLATYEKPYNPAQPVVCLDAKPVSLHADVRTAVPARPGKPAKQDNEYERRGTANVFGVVEPKAGRHFTAATPDRCAAQFARLVGRIVEHYQAAKTIHLVMDNLNIHCRKSLTDCFGEERGGGVGIGSPCITLPNTAVGSTKRRSNSACSHGNVWARGGCRI